MVRLWRNAWAEFIPFLDYDVEIRRVLLDPNGPGQARWAVRWRPALNAFAITFADRMVEAQNQ